MLKPNRECVRQAVRIICRAVDARGTRGQAFQQKGVQQVTWRGGETYARVHVAACACGERFVTWRGGETYARVHVAACACGERFVRRGRGRGEAREAEVHAHVHVQRVRGEARDTQRLAMVRWLWSASYVSDACARAAGRPQPWRDELPPPRPPA